MQEKTGKARRRAVVPALRQLKKETVGVRGKRLLTTREASQLLGVSRSYWWGRGKSRPDIEGIIRLGGLIRVDLQKFGVSLQDGALDGLPERQEKAIPTGTLLPPGDYSCLACKWTGHVARPVLASDLRCPQCQAVGRVALVG